MGLLGMHCDSETESRDMEVKVLVAQSMLDSLQPHGLCPTRLICPWNSPGKNIELGRHSLLQGIFLTQGSNLVPCIPGRFFITKSRGKPSVAEEIVSLPRLTDWMAHIKVYTPYRAGNECMEGFKLEKSMFLKGSFRGGVPEDLDKGKQGD